MSELAEHSQFRLFRFRVPGQTCDFALPVQWTAGVARIPSVTRIPLVPPSILGVGRWLDQPISILDLGIIVKTDSVIARTPADDGLYLIVREPTGRGLVGWLIAPGAETALVMPKMPAALMPPDIRRHVVYAAISIEDEPVVILNPAVLLANVI